MSPEKFLTPKEIVAEIKEHHGVTVSRQFVCAMIRASRVPRFGLNVRLSELTVWWLANPDFSPRSRVTAGNNG